MVFPPLTAFAAETPTLHPHRKKTPKSKIFSAKNWQNKNGTPTLRNQQVILSNHVAELYGVETREINQAVKKTEKFPEGYIIGLNKKEKEEVIKIFDNLGNILYSPAPPKPFTEKGALHAGYHSNPLWVRG